MPPKIVMAMGVAKTPVWIVLVFAALAGGGCYPASGPAPGDSVAQERFWTGAPEDVRIEALRLEISETCPQAHPAEVAKVAGTVVRYGDLIRDDYQLTRPPEYNNVLIAWGLKDKPGRCYELADDLYIRLRAMRLRTLQLHRAISKEGHPTDEHNVVVVTDIGQPIETGIVLDLWRYAGKVRFLPVAADHNHQWKERPITATPPAELVKDETTAAGEATPASGALPDGETPLSQRAHAE
jgi:hypothetical protein